MDDRYAIESNLQRKEPESAANVLDSCIGPLFYRVRKGDLNLSPQHFNEPLCIEMNRVERAIYDLLFHRISEASKVDFRRNLELLLRLRRGRMIRLRQSLSYAGLLKTAIDDYDEDLIEDSSLADYIAHYDELEKPAKLERLLELILDFSRRGQKVVVWSNFVRSLELIRDEISAAGLGVGLIYGNTPLAETSISVEVSREAIIAEFVKPRSGIDFLVANPAACGESVSLHKECSNAIYYDLSYNCAQYLQSLDRIHRVGGSEDKPSYYHFLQYQDTIDCKILENLRAKATNMLRVLERDYQVVDADMLSEDDELDGYKNLFE